ncbi:MAG: GNAT family N-acetyltransferase [Opitutaceae bacterium]|nr:GNAT family N-acetyltransferase [Opitutaceae bacterium]
MKMQPISISGVSLRRLRKDDDLVALTALLHRANRPLAERGRRFSATHQSPDVTARRVARGVCLVAIHEGGFIGTITIMPHDPASPTELYREPGIFHFGQFAVDPEWKGRGLGRRLHDAALEVARAAGGHAMLLDTASPAADLIAMYGRWGYAEVGRRRWEVTNYESVLMRRPL